MRYFARKPELVSNIFSMVVAYKNKIKLDAQKYIGPNSDWTANID